jgi:hypothetical protein
MVSAVEHLELDDIDMLPHKLPHVKRLLYDEGFLTRDLVPLSPALESFRLADVRFDRCGKLPLSVLRNSPRLRILQLSECRSNTPTASLHPTVRRCSRSI